MESKTRFPRKQERFITSDRMVITILIVTAVALFLIALAVGIVAEYPAGAWILSLAALIDIGGILLAYRGITLPGRVIVPGFLVIVIGFLAYNCGGLNHISITAFPVVIVLAGLLLGGNGAFIFATIAQEFWIDEVCSEYATASADRHLTPPDRRRGS